MNVESSPRLSLLALLVLLFGLGLTLAGWRYVADHAEENEREQFFIHAADIRDAITRNLDTHIEIMRGASGLFLASGQVTRPEWKKYIEALHLAERFPSLQGIGFIRYVPKAEKEKFESSVRRNTSLEPAGYPNFAIFPAGERDAYYPVEFFEPMQPNVKVIGLDHGAYPPGREALETARDTGQPTISDRLVSVVDRGHKPRFLMVLPVYRNNMPHATVAERRSALLGFVYARHSVAEFLTNLIGQSLLQELYFEIFDGGPQGSSRREPELAHLLYDADVADIPEALRPDFYPRFSTTSRIETGGRSWILYLGSRPGFLGGAHDTVSRLILVGGSLLSLSIFLIVLILSSQRQRVMEELRRQKALMRQVIDADPNAIFVKDGAGNFVLANQAIAEQLGLTAAEMVGRNQMEVTPSRDEAEAFLRSDREVIETRRESVLDEQVTLNSGEKRWFLTVKRPLPQPDGRVHVLGVALDITERKAAEMALIWSEQRFRSILDNSTALIYLKDPEGRYLLINRQFEKVFHTSNAEMAGKTDHEFFSQEFADKFVENDRQVLAGGEALEFEEPVRRDGELHTYISVKFPLFDASGAPYALCGISSDITEFLRLEREAADARGNRLSRSLIQAVGEGMIGVDRSHHVTFMNPKAEELLGVHEAEALGASVIEVIHCQTASGRPVDEETCPLDDVIDSGTAFRTDDWLLLRQGSQSLPIAMVIAPMAENDRISGAVLSFQDVSARKQAEGELKRHVAELARANAELDEFSYVASHDLQEPLRKLTAFSDWLVRDLGQDLPPQAAKDLGFITDAASRMQALVQDLLALSRTGKTSMVREPVRLDEAVDRAVDALSLRIRETGATISRDPLPEVWGDSALLTQLYQNLLGNALKFLTAGKPPQIHLTAQKQGEEWVLGVQDNGIGIKPEYAEQIFQPFKRLHGRGKYEGSGIGLAVCRKVMERHHGRIWVESEEGQGAHFKFALPAQRRDGRPALQ